MTPKWLTKPSQMLPRELPDALQMSLPCFLFNDCSSMIPPLRFLLNDFFAMTPLPMMPPPWFLTIYFPSMTSQACFKSVRGLALRSYCLDVCACVWTFTRDVWTYFSASGPVFCVPGLVSWGLWTRISGAWACIFWPGLDWLCVELHFTDCCLSQDVFR